MSLADSVLNIDLAKQFLAGMEYDSFKEDTQAFYAATRCLEIVSEASRHLSPELKARHSSIPWTKIAGAGNVYRHDYADVAQLQVWQTIHEFLPSLRVAVVAEIAAFDGRQDKPAS